MNIELLANWIALPRVCSTNISAHISAFSFSGAAPRPCLRQPQFFLHSMNGSMFLNSINSKIATESSRNTQLFCRLSAAFAQYLTLLLLLLGSLSLQNPCAMVTLHRFNVSGCTNEHEHILSLVCPYALPFQCSAKNHHQDPPRRGFLLPLPYLFLLLARPRGQPHPGDPNVRVAKTQKQQGISTPHSCPGLHRAPAHMACQ